MQSGTWLSPLPSNHFSSHLWEGDVRICLFPHNRGDTSYSKQGLLLADLAQNREKIIELYKGCVYTTTVICPGTRKLKHATGT